MKMALLRILQGISGAVIGILAIAVNAIISLMLLLKVIGVMAYPPKAPYSATYLLWFVLSIGLWVLVAHTTIGDHKVGRIVAGVFTALSIFSGFVGYAMTWIAMAGYWPLLKMDLRSFGVESTKIYGQSVMGIFFFIFLCAFVFVLAQLIYSTIFWEGYLNWRIGDMSASGLIEGREPKLDIVVCIDSKTKKPVIIPEEDLTTNMMIQGPTGSGKTSQMLMCILAQVLVHPKAGATVIEPKGSFAKAAYQMAKEAGKTYCRFINPEDEDTDILNPLEGDDPDLVASINDAMLSSLFGEQDAFFSKNQSVVAKNVILLLKYLRGNDCTYEDVNMLLLDSTACRAMVLELRGRINVEEPKFSPKRNLLLWFDKEMFGENAEEVRKFTLGLRVQINELLSNRFMKRCIIGKSTINMDRLLAEGGFLAVSTHDGLLKNLSKALGMVVLGHLQAAVERRPLPVDKRDESLKPPVHMIMLDEFGSYVNETFGQFMSKVREYNAPLCLAFQTLSQMEEVGRGNNRAFREKVVSLCRSKICFPDVPPEDAKWYSELSGKYDKEDISTTVGTSTGKTSWFMPDSYRQGVNTRNVETAKVSYTDILEGKPNTVFYRVMQKRLVTEINVGLVDFFDRSFDDPKRIVLPKSQFWFDRVRFHKEIAERDAAIEKDRQIAEKADRGAITAQSINEQIKGLEEVSMGGIVWSGDPITEIATSEPSVSDVVNIRMNPNEKHEDKMPSEVMECTNSKAGPETKTRVNREARPVATPEVVWDNNPIAEGKVTTTVVEKVIDTPTEKPPEKEKPIERPSGLTPPVRISDDLLPLNPPIHRVTSADEY